jgi:2-keto-4-pentenoate hydratase/2-oxohepta-3-ene-1,7-dioic acid hydratase in catechol pathway
LPFSIENRLIFLVIEGVFYLKVIRFADKNGAVRYGILQDRDIYGVEGDIFSDFTIGEKVGKLDDVQLLAPCSPGKVVCIGLNYKDHIQELNYKAPEEPTLFIKPSTSVIGPGEDIIYPPMSRRVDYEGELAVVIKNRMKDVTESRVYENILGYTCSNDVTARDLQERDIQWTRSKSFDTFCPIGPWIETDADPGSLKIYTLLNGEVVQSSNTSHLLFPVNKLISFISQVMTLNPGDVILTGTPAGVGPMNPGDTVEIAIEGIGSLKNTVRCHPF